MSRGSKKLRRLVVPLASPFPLEEPETQGRTLCVLLHWQREGQCSHCVAASLILLKQYLLVSVVQGVL